MRWSRAARAWYAAVAIIAASALVLQFGLVLLGRNPLMADDAPPRGIATARFLAYFTIQSNVLVMIVSSGLARRPNRDGSVWRVLRADAVVGIAVTGLVHWFLLRPLLTLTGADYLADKLLHVVVPLLAVAGWLIFGPHRRTARTTLGWAVLWPVAWAVVIIAQGWFTGWFPYPFLNVHILGIRVVAYVLAITVLFVILLGLLRLGDRRLPDRSGPIDGRR